MLINDVSILPSQLALIEGILFFLLIKSLRYSGATQEVAKYHAVTLATNAQWVTLLK